MYCVGKADYIFNQILNVLMPLLLEIPAVTFSSLFKEITNEAIQ
jgi:hypothetical protein